MKLLLPIFFLFSTFISFSQHDISKKWYGNLSVFGQNLPIVFHIKSEGNYYSGTMDSPRQFAYGIPLNKVKFEESKLNIYVTKLNLEYEGVVSNEHEIIGSLKQNGVVFDMNLYDDSLKGIQETKRFQTPIAPFDYIIKEVSFSNEIDKTILSGTLTIPKKVKKYPIVVLVSGSGPQNRNSEVFGHEPFWVIADYLTKNGIGVLRYDDRGVSKSGGVFDGATTEDLMMDAEAAVSFLKKNYAKKISEIGVIGHSEGGLIAQILASRNKSIDFIVSMAGPVYPIKDLMAAQTRALLSVDNYKENEIEYFVNTNRKLYDLATRNISEEEKRDQLKTLSAEYITLFADNMKETMRSTFLQSAEQIFNPWFEQFLRIVPEDFIKNISCDVFAINGTLDLQVDDSNLDYFQELSNKYKKFNLTIRKYESLNHLFQTAKTGSVQEYGVLKETISEQVLKDIVEYIKSK